MENIQTNQYQYIKDIIIKELPIIIKQDYQIRDFVVNLSKEQFADKKQTDDRFNRLMEELKADREEQKQKWNEQKQKWDEQNRKWDEQNRKWDESQNKLGEIIKAFDRKYDSAIGALGARWGLYTEQSFRNALKGILEESFGVEVINVLDYDDNGEVFGHPEQIEIDIIIKNGELITCEIKSSISKPDMYLFDKKTLFYEKRHGKKANRKIVISPMVDERANNAAKKLGIEVYSNAGIVEK